MMSPWYIHLSANGHVYKIWTAARLKGTHSVQTNLKDSHDAINSSSLESGSTL